MLRSSVVYRCLGALSVLSTSGACGQRVLPLEAGKPREVSVCGAARQAVFDRKRRQVCVGHKAARHSRSGALRPRENFDERQVMEEEMRLDGPSHHAWRQWGPYLSERQWGTVREDYSPGGTAWDSFSHDVARSRAYRWGEDGILGICDDRQILCFALALWNGRDPILKERLFGLTNSEGNHGEDVKECYYYLDATPTHSYLKALYKYPQQPFPYAQLVEESRRRDRTQPEYELFDTGIFAEDRYFDVVVEYAKVDPEDILVRVSATNRGPETAPLHLLPTLWFHNTWAWGDDPRRPELEADSSPQPPPHVPLIRIVHHELGNYWLACEGAPA